MRESARRRLHGRLRLSHRAAWLLALNLAMLALLLIGSSGWNSLLSDATRLALSDLGAAVVRDLAGAERSAWPALLAGHSARHGVTITADGPKPPPGMPQRWPTRGDPWPPPHAHTPFMPSDAPPGPPPDRPNDGRPRQHRPPPDGPPPDRAGMADTSTPPGSFGPKPGSPDDRLTIAASGWRGPYRIVIPETIATDAGVQPIDIVVRADSLPALIAFLGIGRWLRLAALAIGGSALIWVPFFIGITRSIQRLERATGLIAAGQFSVRVNEARSDEIGDLAAAVDDMAARLESHVGGQKQFLADVAHETISPLARIQLGLGMLEARVDGDARALLHDVQDDATQMAELLNELLLFSRAGVEAEQRPRVPTLLRQALMEAADREDVMPTHVEIDPALRVASHPPLLGRALGNLLRNARKHGGSGPIEVHAHADGAHVVLRLSDRGPGVPEAMVHRLGEPFFRGDASRDRSSGGHGLGIAIVSRCISACGGEVKFRNRDGGGFEVELRLQPA